MRLALMIALLTVAACTGKRSPESDTGNADTTSLPASAQSESAPVGDKQPTSKTKAPAPIRAGTRTKTTGASGSSRTQIDTNAPLHPTDTFALHPRDSTIADFLKKRPPEVRRTQDPRTPPR